MEQSVDEYERYVAATLSAAMQDSETPPGEEACPMGARGSVTAPSAAPGQGCDPGYPQFGQSSLHLGSVPIITNIAATAGIMSATTRFGENALAN